MRKFEYSMNSGWKSTSIFTASENGFSEGITNEQNNIIRLYLRKMNAESNKLLNQITLQGTLPAQKILWMCIHT